METLLKQLQNNPEVETIFGLRFDSSFKSYYKEEFHFKTLLSDLFQEKIVEQIDFRSEEFSKDNIHLRCCRSDLIGELDSSILLMELQNQNSNDFQKRLKRYASLLYVNQAYHEDYQNIKPVKVYLILNYHSKRKKSLKSFSELEIECYEKFDDLSDIKVWNIKDALKENKNSLNYKYARLFSLDDFRKEEALEILEEYYQDDRFKEVVKQIIFYNLDIKTYQMLKEEKFMEESWELATSGIRALGERIGEKRGITIGEKRGIKKATKEIASNLLQAGIPIELIAKATKLSEQQIQNYVRS